MTQHKEGKIKKHRHTWTLAQEVYDTKSKYGYILACITKGSNCEAHKFIKREVYEAMHD